MYTIWFVQSEWDWEWLCLNVRSPTIDLAQAAWDKLQAGGFIMKSQRP